LSIVNYFRLHAKKKEENLSLVRDSFAPDFDNGTPEIFTHHVDFVTHCVRGKFLLLREEKVAADSEYNLKTVISFRCRMTDKVYKK